MALNFSQPTWLYIAYDKNSNALYVGISSQPQCRIRDHERKAVWKGMISRFDFKKFEDRFDAMQAEREAIEQYLPPHNISLHPMRRKNAPRKGGA